jgi:hypothetical protein
MAKSDASIMVSHHPIIDEADLDNLKKLFLI